MKKNWISSLGALFCALAISGNVTAANLSLKAGTMSAGGAAGVVYNMPDITDTASGGLLLGVNGGMSFFVIDYLAVGFNITGGISFANQASATKVADRLGLKVPGLGAGVTVAYYFDTSTNLFPYLSAEGDFMWARSTAGANNLSIRAKPAVGFLLGLNEHVALNFGIDSTFDIPLQAAQPTSVSLGGGFVGVMGFF